MQYPQQGWNQQGGYPSQNAGYPAGMTPQQLQQLQQQQQGQGQMQGQGQQQQQGHPAGWGGAPQYPGYGGYPAQYPAGYGGMYPPQAGMYHPGGMYPPQPTGMFAGGAPPPTQVAPPKKAEIVKPAANPIEALFGSKADPTATQAARARRVSNPPPVQPTPQENKPAPKRAPNYNINLSEEPSDGGLGVPGTPSSHAVSSNPQAPGATQSSSATFPGQPQGQPSGPPQHAGIHSSSGFPGQPGAFPGAHPGLGGSQGHPGAQPGSFPGSHSQGPHPSAQSGQFTGAHAQGPHPSQHGHPGSHAQGAAPPGGFPPGAHQGAAGFPPGAFPGQAGYNQFYGGYPPGAAYGYGAPAINQGSFFLPPTAGAPPNPGAAPLTPSSGSSPLPSPSPVITPSQAPFQQGILGTVQPHQTPSQLSLLPTTPSAQRPHSPMHSGVLQTSQPSLLPSHSVQPAMSPSNFLQPSTGMQRSASQSGMLGASSPTNSIPRVMQSSASMSNASFPTQFQAASDDWAGAEFTTPSASGDDFGGFNTPSSNEDFGGFNAPSPSSSDFGGFNTPSNAPSNDFGFSEFQGVNKSPSPVKVSIPQQPPKAQENDFFGFDSPSTAAPASPAKTNIITPDELAPSPKLSRSTKHLSPQPADDDFFGAATNKRHSASFTPPPQHQQPTQDLEFSFDQPSESTPAPAPEPPKKPANALESMMENSLFKVTHKPPPMAKAATQQPQSQSQSQSQPQQPAAPQIKQSTKKFDWSSQNYRDIFGESETPAPAPNPAIAQEQFEGFVSASASAGSDEFEFGAFEGSSNADPFASSSPPSFASAPSLASAPSFTSAPSFSTSSNPFPSPFPTDTFGSEPTPQVSPFPSEPFGAKPEFSNISAEPFQPTFAATPSLLPASTPSAPTFSPAPISAATASGSPFGGDETFSSSFQGSGSEMFSSHQLAPHDQFGFPSPAADTPAVPFDSPFAPQAARPATVPTPAPTTSSSPSTTPATVSTPAVSSEPPFGNFFAARRASIPKVDDKPLFGDAETAFGDFGKQSTSTPPTPANSVVGPPRSTQQVESEPAFGTFFGSTNASSPSSTVAHGEEAHAFGDFYGQSKSSAPPTPANTVVQSDSSSIAAPTESFGSFYDDNSARRTGAQADPTFGGLVSKSTSVPPTPANSVDKEGSNSENFFSSPFPSNNLQPAPAASTSSYDAILAKPLNTLNYSPSSSVVAPGTKSSGDWGLPSTASNNNNNNTSSGNSNDFFGSPFESSSTATTTSTPSTSSFSTSFPSSSSSSNKAFSINTEEMFGSSFDTSFGNVPAFPLEDSFGSPEAAKPNYATSSEEFGTFSSSNFGGEDFGDFSNATEFGDFGPSTPFGEEDITYKPSPAPSLTDIFQSLIQQERLEEANACQVHIKNGTQPSSQELAAWSSPNSTHATIAQLKDRLLSHPNQAKVLKHFAQFEKQPLATVALINLQSAIESQKYARQFVTAVLEWQNKWEKQLAWCATEIASAQKLAAEICSSSGMQNWDPQKEIFTQQKWATYFKALQEVYRVASRLNAAAQHYHVPPSPHYATLAVSWSVLTAMLKVDEISVDYSETWDEVEEPEHDCALCHVPITKTETSAPWDGASYHLSCANVWANRISRVPPHKA